MRASPLFHRGGCPLFFVAVVTALRFSALLAKVANALCTLPYRRWRVKVRAPCRELTAPPTAAKTKSPAPTAMRKIAAVSGHFCVAALG